MTELYVATEGVSDEGVLGRIASYVGFTGTRFYGKKGKEYIRSRIKGYNSAAQHQPWLVVVDLDSKGCSPAALRSAWLACESDFMVFRVAVMEIESWLIADRERIAKFLSISEHSIPRSPDTLEDPKQTLVNLARKSRKREIREGLVPRKNSGISIGPTYPSEIHKFGAEGWRPEVALESSDSLKRCVDRLRGMKEKYVRRQ